MTDLYPAPVYELLDHLRSAQRQRSVANMKYYVDRALADVKALEDELFEEAISTKLAAVRR
jgi:hypothetical protein